MSIRHGCVGPDNHKTTSVSCVDYGHRRGEVSHQSVMGFQRGVCGWRRCRAQQNNLFPLHERVLSCSCSFIFPDFRLAKTQPRKEVKDTSFCFGRTSLTVSTFDRVCEFPQQLCCISVAHSEEVLRLYFPLLSEHINALRCK